MTDCGPAINSMPASNTGGGGGDCPDPCPDPCTVDPIYPLEVFSGTHTVDSTEWSLTANAARAGQAQTTKGQFEIFVDVNAMAAGDLYEMLAYEKIVSGGTQRSWSLGYREGTQPGPWRIQPAEVLMWGWDYSLILRSGSAKSLTWSIRKLNGSTTP